MVADDFNACHDEACWSRTISPVAAKVPVVVTECGFSIPWAQGLWGWIEQQRGSISYLAWTWNTCEPPRHRWHLGCILPRVPAMSLRTGGGKEGLVSDYAGTATAWGKAFKAQIAKAKTDDNTGRAHGRLQTTLLAGLRVHTHNALCCSGREQLS